MTIHAFEARVRGILKRGVLRLHDRVACQPTESYRVHIGYCLIRQLASDDEIGYGCEPHEVDELAQFTVAPGQWRKMGRIKSRSARFPSLPMNTGRNEDQPRKEAGR